jgi:hypothetical protein
MESRGNVHIGSIIQLGTMDLPGPTAVTGHTDPTSLVRSDAASVMLTAVLKRPAVSRNGDVVRSK